MRLMQKAMVLAAALAAVPAMAVEAKAAPKAEVAKAPAAPTLYERLGGVYPIAAVVDDFIDRVMTDPALNANKAVDEAHHRVAAAGFKYQVVSLLCQAAGGPQQYVGNDMKVAHAALGITGPEWQAFMKDLRTTLDKFKVPEREQGEVIALVESTRNDIVVAAGKKSASAK